MSRWLVLAATLVACDKIEPFYDDSENRACDPRTAWFADTDADGFGNAADVYLGCSQPTGFVTDNTDCNDTDPALQADCPVDTGADTSDTSGDTGADTGDTSGHTGADTSDTSGGDTSGDSAVDTDDSASDTSGDTSDADSGV